LTIHRAEIYPVAALLQVVDDLRPAVAWRLSQRNSSKLWRSAFAAEAGPASSATPDPEILMSEKIVVSKDRGVLRLRMPKKKSHRPLSIPIAVRH